MSIFGSPSNFSIDSSLVKSRASEIEYALDDDIFNGDNWVVDKTIELIIDYRKMIRMGGTVYIFKGQDSGWVAAKSALGCYELVKCFNLYCPVNYMMALKPYFLAMDKCSRVPCTVLGNTVTISKLRMDFNVDGNGDVLFA